MRAAHPLHLLLGVTLVALVAAGFAISFRFALSGMLHALFGASDVVSAMRRAPWHVRLLAPALGGLLSGLVGLWVAREKSGHGVSDVMEAVVLGRVKLSARVTLVKSLASWLAIAGGGSLGREGPLIQFGGLAGKLVGQRLRLPLGEIRLLIAAGTAAGFAAAYNTPFAAVLFVLEVVLGVVVSSAIVPVLIATVIAAECTRLVLGPGPLYGARAFSLQSPRELLAFALLGLLGALFAHAFMWVLHASERWFHGLPLARPFRTALGGLLAGGFIVWIPEIAGNGYEPLQELLSAGLATQTLLALLVAKALATAANVSSGNPGGVFTPTLLIGGSAGYLVGSALHHVFGAAIGAPGGYALVGMAATLAGTTHAPLLSSVMIFELSGDYAIVLPLCLSTAIATSISRRVRKDSIYTAELHEKGMAWEMTLEGRRLPVRADPDALP